VPPRVSHLVPRLSVPVCFPLSLDAALGDVVRHPNRDGAGESGHLLLEWPLSQGFLLRTISLRLGSPPKSRNSLPIDNS
jgi:hypothetical protein